eukprot:scaffold54489_cov20-Tisochrysis_lutea.AAC.3
MVRFTACGQHTLSIIHIPNHSNPHLLPLVQLPQPRGIGAHGIRANIPTGSTKLLSLCASPHNFNHTPTPPAPGSAARAVLPAAAPACSAAQARSAAPQPLHGAQPLLPWPAARLAYAAAAPLARAWWPRPPLPGRAGKMIKLCVCE